jgi:NADP-dependent 3-hydroxy acid dehydrogenase YdfG
VIAVARNLERLNDLVNATPAARRRVRPPTRLALPGMRKRGFVRILAIVSSGVIQPIPNLSVSNALRSAVVGWAKTLAGEVAGDGVSAMPPNSRRSSRFSRVLGRPI